MPPSRPAHLQRSPLLQATALKSLWPKLREARRIALLGVGSELRGDDVAGVLVARALAEWQAGEHAPLAIELAAFDGGSAPENLTGEIAKLAPDHLIVVDAAELGREPGAIECFGAERIDGISFATHMLPLRIMIDYLAKRISFSCSIIGIQPAHKDVCAPPSQAVQAAVDDVVREIVRLLTTKQDDLDS